MIFLAALTILCCKLSFVSSQSQHPVNETKEFPDSQEFNLTISDQLMNVTYPEFVDHVSPEVPVDSCPSVSNLTAWEIHVEGQTILIINWDSIFDSKVTNICATVSHTEEEKNCSMEKTCDISPNFTEYRFLSSCSYQPLNLTVTFLCSQKEGEADVIEYKTKAGKPSEPRELQKESVNSTSVTVTWQKPDRLNGPLDGYIIDWTDSADVNESIQINSTFQSWCIGGLQPWTNYTVKIKAFNYFDNDTVLTGPAGEIEITTRSSEAGPPTDVRISSYTNISFVVEWKEPVHANGVILGYKVSWRFKDAGDFTFSSTVSSENRLMEVTLKVRPYKEYAVQVMAINDAGYGRDSDPVYVKTKTGIPDPPRNLTTVNVTDTTAFVTWMLPLMTNGPILQYTVTIGNSSWSTNTTNTTFLFNDLTPVTAYEISAQAWTSAGESEWATILTQTDAGIPDTPEDVILEEIGPKNLLVTWKEPKDKNGNVDGYLLKYFRNDSGDSELHVVTNGKTHRYNIQGLLPWTSYIIKLSSFNINIEGSTLKSRETVLSQQTSEYYPGLVENVTLQWLGNTSFSAEWDPPRELNGILLAYTIQLWSNTSNVPKIMETRNDSAVVEYLEPFTSYVFSVCAKNAYGSGNCSLPLSLRTDVGVPGVPEDLKIQNMTATELSVLWKMPLQKAGPIDGYIVTCNRVQGVKQTTSTVWITEMHISFRNLLPWTSYLIDVRAYNKNRNGEFLIGDAADSRVRTSAAVPLPVIITSVASQSSTSVWLEWENQGIFPGPTTYVVEVWQKLDICQSNSEEDSLVRNHTNDAMSWKASATVIRNLEPYTLYFFRVVVSTEAGSSNSNKSLAIVTDPDVPTEPQEFRVNCSFSSTSALISWSSPQRRNGIIVEYYITYVSRKNATPKVKPVPIPPMWTCQKTTHHITIDSLDPETVYRFSIKAKTNNLDQYGPEASYDQCILPAGVPPIPDNSSKPEIQDTSDQDVTLRWSKAMFSAEMGQIMYYSVIVAAPNVIGQPRNGSVKEIDPLPVWAEFWSQDTKIYQATPKDWNPFLSNSYDPLNCQVSTEFGKEMLHCIVGWEKNCTPDTSIYCNGPLKPGKVYGMKLRGFTNAGFAETYPLFVKTDSSDNSLVLGLSVGLVMTCLVLCSVGFGYVLLKRKNKCTASSQIRFFRKPVVENQEAGIALARLSNGKPCEIKQKSPMDFPSFLERITEMMSDSALQFSLEFETLKQNSFRHPCSVAEMEENRCKNRWTNILPFDHSRVKLLPIDDEPGSDYINASYIPGFSGHREYIASQGPLPSTVDDFWRMIWEQKVSMIVMLTQCVERGKTKCEQYWPKVENKTAQYGDLKVHLISESVITAYAVRTFSVTLGTRQCLVKQVHYVLWPDFGCPESPEELVNFVRTVKVELLSENCGPILVHCSAGVGRTGTFIAVDRLLQHVQHHNDLDIFMTVMEMREHRTNMVQTEDQYIYIHKCLKDIIIERINCAADNCDLKGVAYSNAMPLEAV